MKRKTFVKQMMALGVPRNEVNSICRDDLLKRDLINMHGGKTRFSYENAFKWTCFYYGWGMHISGRPLTVMERQKFRVWREKRTKIDPLIAWEEKNHKSILGGVR